MKDKGTTVQLKLIILPWMVWSQYINFYDSVRPSDSHNLPCRLLRKLYIK